VRLDKPFRNGIIEAVDTGGLEPRECTFDFNDDGGCRVTHTPSGSSFVLGGTFGHFTTTTVVGEGPPGQLDVYSWRAVEVRVERWAGDVKRNAETTDLWAELQGEREILAGARYQDVENTPFTSDERAEIAEQLREIKEFVRTRYSLSEAEARALEARLDYVEAAGDRMGRKDWRLLFYGQMLDVIIGGLLAPDVVRDILTMALQGLQFVLGGGLEPPQLRP
jgi:hypothetical protein